MADKETPVIEKPDYESTKPQNPLSSIISKFTEIFNFRFPPPPVRKKIQSESKSSVVEEDESKAVIVRFPDAHVVQPLKLQAQELERDTNPVFLWQVYAVGGFFVLRWVLARWNERRANKKPSKEDSPPPPPPSAEGND